MELKEFQGHVKDLLLHDDVRNAFKQWFLSKYPDQDELLVKALNTPQPSTWSQFKRTEAYQSLNIVDKTDNIGAQTSAADVNVSSYSAAAVNKMIDAIPAVEEKAYAPNTNASQNASVDVVSVLAKALEAHGLNAKAQLDTDQISDIARKEALIAAKEAAETALLEAIESGLLVTKQEHTYKINDNPPVVTDAIHPKWFDRMVKLAMARENIMLVGPRGSGKTHAAEELAKVLGLPFYFTSFSAGVDESELKGVLNPLTGEYIDSNFIKAYKFGGVFLGDEFDAADANVTICINAAIDNGHFSVPLRKEEPIIDRHPDFIFIAAANTHGHGANRSYVGRNQLDSATLDRFSIGQINTDYDENTERKLFAENLDVCKFGQRLRARCRDIPGHTRDVSTRNILRAVNVVRKAGVSVNEAWYGFFSDWKESELDRFDITLDHDNYTANLR